MNMLWLVGLGLALLCTVSAESECSKDHISKMHGKWYVIGMASDCDEFLKHKDMMKIVPAHVTLKPDSKLLISTNIPGKEGCRKMDMEFEKLADGTYFHSSEWGTAKKMEVVATDCQTYAILHAQMERKGKTSNFMAMYTRSPEGSMEHQKKFSESCENLKFKSDQCMHLREVACDNEEEDEMMPTA